MLKSPFLFAVSVLVALIQWAGTAKAQDLNMGLSFELPPIHAQSEAPDKSLEAPGITPVPVEIVAASSTLETDMVVEDVSATANTIESMALTFAADAVSIASIEREAVTNTSHFDPLANSLLEEVPETVSSSPADRALGLDDWIFENGTHSLVARTVGNAEGTRRADGRRTEAYYGHTDPGNGVWNLGTFSYQHEASSPEDADERQLRRLKRQGIELEAQATQQGLVLSLEEKLNGLDLANQAPLAALDQGGYIDRLAQAKRLQMKGSEAILWARTHAYIDPDTRRWNAPGLGNNVHSISKDQERRISAISSAMKAYSPRGLDIAALARLEQVRLIEPAPDSPPTLIASTSEENTPTFGSINTEEQIFSELADFAVSFGLPSADATSESVVVATSSPQTDTDDLVIANNALHDAVSSHVAVSDIGITFSPTGNITEHGTVVSLPDSQDSPSESSVVIDEPEDDKNRNIINVEVEASTNLSTELFALNPINEDLEDGQTSNEIGLSNIEPSNIKLSNEVESFEEANNSEEANSVKPTAEVVSDSAATALLEETANHTDEQLHNTVEDSAAQLQSLLTGVSTTADPETLANLKNSGQANGPESARQFFRTEDKIVREK